jgi:5-formyltetrahydrofolate cyclo-ligase
LPSDPTPAAVRKVALRERMIAARVTLSPDERAAASRAIASRLESLPAWSGARTVALYASMGAEVDTAGLALRAAAGGKRVAWPRLSPSGKAMEFAACAPSDLVAGPARAPEPPATATSVQAGEIDLVAVPGVAFDAQGRRLGRGRGHYDATLARLRPGAFRVGLAFESQIVPAVPAEPHDERLDAVVTEARLLLATDGPG